MKENKNKLISVIMATYNPKNLDKVTAAIDSILQQTYSNLELIICDDGSSDYVRNYLKEVEKKDSRIKCIYNDKNHGLAYSLNACLDEAKGDFIARQDDDDVSKPDRLKIQMDFLDKNPSIGFVGSAVDLFDDSGIWGKSAVIPFPKKEDFLKRSPFAHPTILARREAYDAVGGYRVSKETMRAQDYDMFMRMYAIKIYGANIGDSLYEYYQGMDSYKKVKFQHKLGEFMIRMRGFKAMHIMFPKGMIAMFKPLVVALIPYSVRNKYMKKGKNNE